MHSTKFIQNGSEVNNFYVLFLPFSIGEWEQYMKECQAFIFYGLEKLFSFFPPAKIAPVHLAGKMQLTILC